jgi:hypothetical protein
VEAVVAHAVATWFLVGMIWTVQIVHYPLFAQVGREGFAGYAAAHSTRITAVIAVPWAVQGTTVAWLLLDPPVGLAPALLVAAGALALVPVVVTVLVSVAAHRVLGAGFDAAAHRRLVTTNWLRTGAWTLGGGVAVAMLVAAP